MIDVIILIGCILVAGFIGYTAGYNYGYDDGALHQVQKQIDEKRKQLLYTGFSYWFHLNNDDR